MPDAGGGEVEEGRAAESSGSENEDGSAFEAELAVVADAGEAEVPGKTAELGVTKLRRGG